MYGPARVGKQRRARTTRSDTTPYASSAATLPGSHRRGLREATRPDSRDEARYDPPSCRRPRLGATASAARRSPSGGLRARRGRRPVRPGDARRLRHDRGRLRRARREPARGGRASGYHELIDGAPPGRSSSPDASVLEIGSGDGDLLAALEPARGRRRRRQPAAWSSSRGRGIPELRVRASARARTSSSTRRSTTSSSPTSCRTSTTCSALFAERRARIRTRETRIVIHSYSQLWRPVLRLARAAAPQAAQADPQLGDARRRREPARSSPGSSRSTATRRILLPAADPVRLGLPATASSRNLWLIRHLCLTYWIVARARPTARAPGAQRLGRRARPERGRA